MYDFKLNDMEEIKLISDDTIVFTDREERNVTCIITNMRLLILEYPGGLYNSAEDLRISGKLNYIKKKEIVVEINLNDILAINEEKNYYKLIIKNGSINLNDNEIVNYLKKNYS